jgi:radical SAM protein with 4Fe4S-binding SPASM domain
LDSIVLSTPTIYSVELTPACDNRCAGCSNVFARDRAPLSASGWRQVLARIAPHAQVLKLTGGEPTLHPEFAEIVQAIAEEGISFTLFTNAHWRSPQAVIDLLKATPQCGGLLISLHGPDAVTHEAFTNAPGSFAETCANIRRATAAGLRVHTSTVITRHNWDRVQEIAALALSLGAERAVFNRYLGLEMPDIEPDEWQLRHAVQTIESIRCEQSATVAKFGNCIPRCFVPSSSTGCWAGIAYCTIDPWGNMRPCNHSPLICGNLLETPIEELWQSEAMNRWRELLPAECEGCGELSTCHGGCRAMIEIRRLERDPLAGCPLPQADHPPREITLYEGARPVGAYQLRPEPFGYVLLRGQRFIPVTSEARPLLEALDGKSTLAQLQNRFGQEVLDFVGQLYIQGMVELI